MTSNAESAAIQPTTASYHDDSNRPPADLRCRIRR